MGDVHVPGASLQRGWQVGSAEALRASRNEGHEGFGPHERMHQRKVLDAVMVRPVHGDYPNLASALAERGCAGAYYKASCPTAESILGS